MTVAVRDKESTRGRIHTAGNKKLMDNESTGGMIIMPGITNSSTLFQNDEIKKLSEQYQFQNQ
jgi:hypothetical protein